MKLRKLLFVIISLCISGHAALAQLNSLCPGCIANTAQFGTNINDTSVGLFPDTIVIRQNSPVNIDVTYLLPLTANTGISIAPTATVLEVQILGVNASTPLPSGLNVTCDSSRNGCEYFPPSYRFGCVKICGTTPDPATNGFVLANITVAGTGTAAGQTQTQIQNIRFYYKILPDTTACHDVCFTNKINSGCDSATLGVYAGIDISCPNPVLNPCSFDWVYGNGTTGSGLTAQSVTYAGAGTYPVTLQTYTKQLQITGASFSVPQGTVFSNTWYDGICDGYGVNTNADDFNLNISIGSTVNSTSGAGGGNFTGSYTGLNYVVTSQAVAITVVNDCALSTYTSQAATINITGAGVYPWSANGGSDATGSITVSELPMDSATYTDSVYIYASPDTPRITLSADSVCLGDSILLSIDSSYASDHILWYLNDTTYLAVYSDTCTTISVQNSGSYSVTVINPVTHCQAVSRPVPVVLSTQLVSQPTIYYQGSGRQLFLDPSITQGILSVWYYDSTVVLGQNGEYLPVVGNGNYYAFVYPVGFPQCGQTSAVYNYSNVGISEVSDDISGLSVFPNPNSGIFSVRANIQSSGSVTIRLTDMLGRVVYENTLAGQSGEVKDNINVSSLARDVYTLEVATERGRASQRVVIE